MTNVISFLLGRLCFFPCQSPAWIVNASIVTVKCLVWTCEKHLPPELYLLEEKINNNVIKTSIRSKKKKKKKKENLRFFFFTWRISRTWCRSLISVQCRTSWLSLLFRDWMSRGRGTSIRHPGTKPKSFCSLIGWFLRERAAWLPYSRRRGTRNTRPRSKWWNGWIELLAACTIEDLNKMKTNK